jgi:hypothetical protein
MKPLERMSSKAAFSVTTRAICANWVAKSKPVGWLNVVSLTDCLTLDPSKVNSLLHGIILDDFDDGEAVDGEEMSVRTVPHCTRGRRRVVKIHPHACFLRTLAGENVDGGSLRNFGGPFENLLATIVHCLNLDNHLAIAHADVADINLKVIARQYYSNESGVVSVRQ